MLPKPSDQLDDAARRELEAEQRLHQSNVGNIPVGNPDALTRECDRHFERLHQLMQALLRRRSG